MGISRIRVIVATLLFMCSFFFVQEEGLWGLFGFAISFFAGITILLHGHWQATFDVLWRLGKIVTEPHRRATRQRYCVICKTPARYKVIDQKDLVLERAPGEDIRISCGCCRNTALYQIQSILIPMDDGVDRANDPGIEFVCREHHPNPAIGKRSQELNDLLLSQGKAPQWVRCIFYPGAHTKPKADESREHHVCADHHVHSGVGPKTDETLAFLAKVGHTWESVYPVYNDAGLFSLSGGRTPEKKN